MGVRAAAAGEMTVHHPERWGALLEQWVALQLLAIQAQQIDAMKIWYWRDLDGPEVDLVVEKNGIYTPIEVKWTTQPSSKDIRHLKTFMTEYPCEKGVLICRVPRAQQMTDNILALPWYDLTKIMEGQGVGG